MAKPTTVPTWSTNTNYAASTQPWAGTPTKVQPPSGTQTEGLNPEDQTVAQYENWLRNLFGQWCSWINAGALIPIGRQVISANGTYTPTTGALAVRLRMVGGGGGGGGGNNTTANVAAGAGGASGVYYEAFINPGVQVTGGAVAIGAAGTAGTTGGGGGNGGDTTIVIQGTTYTAKGGGGGGGSSLVAAGPSVSTPGTVVAGSSAGDIVRSDRGQPGLTINGPWCASGAGGGGLWGTGGASQNANATAVTGVAGQGNGAGGSGGVGYNSTAGNGGVGTAGLIIVEEFGAA